MSSYRRMHGSFRRYADGPGYVSLTLNETRPSQDDSINLFVSDGGIFTNK